MATKKTKRPRRAERPWKPPEPDLTADMVPKFSRIALMNGGCMVRRLPTLSELDRGKNDEE